MGIAPSSRHEKVCFKCGVLKDIGEFYSHPMMSDGHLGKCKDCTKKDVLENRRSRIAYYQEFDRRRSKDEDRRLMGGEYQRSSRRKHRLAHLAYSAVYRAIRDGILSRQPCAICGSVENVEAHHADYSRPLEVTWLCWVCHRRHTHGQIILDQAREAT